MDNTQLPADAPPRPKKNRSYMWLYPPIYIAFLMVPIYWLINVSFKSNQEIVSGMSLFPQNPTLAHYITIFSDPSWYSGYINSGIYVALNVVMSVSVALPAAYAFSRYQFLGDKHLFFWFLASRMTPPAVLIIPFFQLYTNLGIIDTHIAVALAHALFNVPIAVWILEGFISSVPREIDESAQIDGYSFPRFFIKIMLPMIKPGIGVAAYFCFMFSWVELLLANALTTVDAKPIGAIMGRAGGTLSGLNLGLLASVSVLAIIPGVVMIYFVRKHIANGFALGQVR